MNRRASDDMATTTAGRGDTGDRSGQKLEQEAETAREAAREAARAGKQRLEAGAGQAAESVDHVAEAVGTAASRLSEMDHEGLADYANRLASWLSDMSERLRSSNVDDIGNEVRRIAQRNPALFVLGSVAVGVGLARFAKASRRDDESREWDGAAGEPGWARGESPREWSGSDTDRTEDTGARELEAAEPPISTYEESTYEGRDTGSASERRADRPTTPDSSGGGGL